MRIAGLGIVALLGAFLRPERASSLGDRARVRAACRSWWGGGLALVLLCLAVYVPGQAVLPPIDRDESRFAQATRQMVESGDYVLPRVQDRPRLNKPPLIYWAQAASVAVFGDRPGQHASGNIWVFRVPSALAMLAAVLMTWRLGLLLFDPRAAVLGAALLAVCPLIAWEAHQARADALLVAATTAAMWALAVVWRNAAGGTRSVAARWLAPIAFWLAMGAGIMTKGPLTPMVAGLAVVGLCAMTRRARWVLRLRPILGLLIVAAIVGPWVYAVGERVGWDRYVQIILDETIGRAASAKESHWAPPGYHLVLLVALFWPGSLLTGLAIARAWRRRRRARGAAELFLLCWVVPSWIVFEIVATKLPHYTMPLYPAIALLSARAVFAAAAGVVPAVRGIGARIGFGIWFAVGLAALGGLAFLWVLGTEPPVASPALVWFFLGVTTLNLALAGRDTRRNRFLHAQSPAVMAAIGLAAVATAASLPRHAILSLAAAEMIEASDPTTQRPVGLLGYHEDSLVFLTRGRAQRLTEDRVAAWSREHPDGLLIVAYREGSTPPPVPPHAIRGVARGFNYSKGRSERLVLVDIARLSPDPVP